MLFACPEVHMVFGTAFMVIVATGGLRTLLEGQGHKQGLQPQMRQQQEDLTQQQGME